MKFGCFGFTNQIEMIEKLGYDCIELDLSEIVSMSEREVSSLRRRVEASRLGFEVFSGLIPLTVRFHAPDFDETYWLEHIRTAARRAAALGCVMIPFGAGKCRSIPEDCPSIQTAKDHVTHLVRTISDIVGEHGITLVVEPLGPANSNYVNTIPEAEAFLRTVNRSNCLTMCDLRHMHKQDEPLCHIPQYATKIRHAHIDYPQGTARLFPQEGDGYDYAPYFQALRDAGYNAILTIEATAYTDFEREAGSALAYLQKLNDT